MVSLPYDGVDELLFDLYKKEVLKHLKSKMDHNVLRALEMLRDDSAGLSNRRGCMLRLECFVASIVSGEGLAASGVPKVQDHALNARLQSLFGHVLTNEAISGIVGMFASRCANVPHLQQDYEELIVDLVKVLVDSSCLKMNDGQFFTPALKRKADGMCSSPVLPCVEKHHAKKPSLRQQSYNVDARILFPEVSEIHVVEGYSKTIKELNKDANDVIFLKELKLKDKLNKMCNSTNAMYNKDILHENKVNEEQFSKGKPRQSPGLSFVSEDGHKSIATREPGKFPVTAQEKRYYNAVCSLASSCHAGSVVVDIGGCNLKYFALGDSMALGNQVCSFVVNCLCRKFFMDERPTISNKHYFFSHVSEVFLSNSSDYSHVDKCFSGAASVLPLPLCDSLFFPVLFDHHWFLFVVDLKNKLFTFLDSYYSKNDDYSVRTRKKLKESFCHAWSMYVGSDPGFNNFRTCYARVPKQANKVDCGVFTIKFMEVWKFGCNMLEVFSQEDIPNIRVQIVNDLLFSKHNSADVSIVKSFNPIGSRR